MSSVKRIVLDVLKPHKPNALHFAQELADQGRDYRIKIKVTEVDKKTESTIVSVEGESIDFDRIVDTISRLGGAIHSIDEVEVLSPSAHAR